jgi:GPI mannosyltransferase 3
LSLRALLWIFLPLAAIPRLWAALFDHGIFWPDEIFQVTEPTHRLAFGYGFTSWEYHDGARSWLLPGLVAEWFRIGDLLGLRSGLALMTSLQLLLAIGSVAALGATMVMAWRIGKGTACAFTGSLALAFPMLLVYGYHPWWPPSS